MKPQSEAVEQWRRAQTLFEAALERPAAERESFVAQVGGEDLALRQSVLRLLAHDRQAASPVDAAKITAPHLESPPDPWVGRQLGNYRLLQPIGQGGMSRVFLAERAAGEVRHQVAIKIATTAAGGGDAVARSQRESQILARLEHPGICRFLDAGIGWSNLPYVVMEHVEGIQVDIHCDQQRLDLRRRLELFLEICEVVRFAHGRLVIHRDLKPANILVTREGRPKLLDFGIAKLLSAADPGLATIQTRTGERFLTPSYASPEQVRGEPAYAAADVYSLGVLLYYLLCGSLPQDWRDASPFEVLERWQREDPPLASEALRRSGAEGRQIAAHRGTVPPALQRQLQGDLDQVCAQALRFRPEDRYPSVDRLMADLRCHLESRPISARPATKRYRLSRLLRRHRRTVWATAAVLAALVFSVVLSVVYSVNLARERDLADSARLRADRTTDFLIEALSQGDPFRPQISTAGGESPNLRQALDASVGRIETDLYEEPLLQATLWHAFGILYKNLGALDTGISLLEKALHQRRLELGDHHPDTGQTLAELGLLLTYRGELQRAEPLVEEAVAIHRERSLEDPEALGRSLMTRGIFERSGGDLEAAEGSWREALDVLEPLPDQQLPRAATLSYLGDLLKLQGNLEEAENRLREALAILSLELGSEHPDTARVSDDLGWVLARQGRSEEAEPLLRNSLALLRQQLGEEHPEVAVALQSVGQFLRRQGDLEEAEKLLRRSLELNRGLYGEEHLQVVVVRNSLALTLRDRGRLAAAEDLLQGAVETSGKLWDWHHPDGTASLLNLGLVLLDQEKYSAASVPLGRFQELTPKVMGEEHWSLGLGLAALARVANGERRYADGHRLAGQAADRLAALGEDHWRLAMAQSVAGESLIGLGRHHEAEPLLLASYERVLAVHGEEARPTREVAHRLALLDTVR